ncbi:hypothetical protein EVAR_78897_1 [Eumeta japonica]|uniref:Uncharacterized protein n=1 Tax=Eumeta variegata TaxID=151549 RepID=A0A4C1U2N9_EUMVA|nr:hypothetical protein EVAR_78897_1 [Eumeta japonica]
MAKLQVDFERCLYFQNNTSHRVVSGFPLISLSSNQIKANQTSNRRAWCKSARGSVVKALPLNREISDFETDHDRSKRSGSAFDSDSSPDLDSDTVQDIHNSLAASPAQI